ncbi:N-acetylmuramoyl-L-alanine amidase [Bacillus sp. NPDC094106]|uniref:N-acetylmuramoyl-L-alanine amidase n=1 Tax=Bacillus sp. NPDC094106 TaxID=3363949 RepID=UPI00381D84F2
MEIKQMLVPESRYPALCPYEMTPTEITFHNTYNDASALNERNNVANNSQGTSFHIAVDDREAIQLIPFNRNAWHAGDGTYGHGNRHSISVEICYSKYGGERYRKAELNAIKVIRQLMDTHNISVSKVKTHQERNGKYCPHRMLDEGRVQWFKSQLTKTEGFIVKENGYKLVATGGIGFGHMKEVAGFLNTLGYGASLVISGKNDALFSIRTERRIGSELDKFTAWLDTKNWWYQYE